MKTFCTYTIQIFKEQLPNGSLTEYVEVKVIADTEEQAIEKAKKVCIRPDYQYRLSRIDEYEKVEKK